MTFFITKYIYRYLRFSSNEYEIVENKMMTIVVPFFEDFLGVPTKKKTNQANVA